MLHDAYTSQGRLVFVGDNLFFPVHSDLPLARSLEKHEPMVALALKSSCRAELSSDSLDGKYGGARKAQRFCNFH